MGQNKIGLMCFEQRDSFFPADPTDVLQRSDTFKRLISVPAAGATKADRDPALWSGGGVRQDTNIYQKLHPQIWAQNGQL